MDPAPSSWHDVPLPQHLRALLASACMSDDLRAELRGTAEILGFVGLTYFTTFAPDSGHPRVAWSTHGDAWDERYRVTGLMRGDPRLATSSTATPTLWDRQRCAIATSAHPFLEAARQHGIGTGIVMRVVDVAQRRAIIALDGDCAPLDAGRIEALIERMAGLMLFAVALHDHVLAPRLAGAVLRRDALSPRECSCLALAARGLTSKDIGHKLGISARTANFHVGNVMRKLGALNRSEAIALGLRAGLIQRG
ncbi:MAG: autoinducer binding domain-containing protein [Proteobacteria bacterium]|nr:autoinducer binding domain-containing protein [Pseudomonadota bacterium]